MAYVIPEPTRPSVAVAGTADRFPVHRVYCVGRNYRAHAREMGHDPDREPPFFFAKPADAVVAAAPGDATSDALAFPYPAMSRDVHHEIELVVALASGGSDLAVDDALDRVYGYGVGLDMTRRDLQREAKKAGRPWAAAKGFDRSAPCSAIVPVATSGHVQSGRIWLEVNGETRQQADLGDMIWGVPEIIAHLSRLFHLRPGDLIFTGTPAGVGAVRPGDTMRGGVDGLGTLAVNVAS